MARVTYGAFVTSLDGSIGGTSFQKNNSGNVARQKASQKFFPSNLQSGSRSDFSAIATSWSLISLSIQALWNAYALANPITDRWGNVRTLTGFQYYMQSNLNLLSLGLTLLASPPAYVAPDIVPPFTALGYSNSLHLNFYPAINFPNSDLVVYATAPTTATKLTNRKNLYLIGGFSSPNASIFDITTMYSNAFGLTWSNFFNSASCNIIFQLMLVNRVTGIASPFTGFVFSMRNYPSPSWSTFGNSYTDLGQQFSQTRIQALKYLRDGVVLSSTYIGNYILRSSNYGLTWSNTGVAGTLSIPLPFAFDGINTVYVMGQTGKIAKSINLGLTFSDYGTASFTSTGNAIINTSGNVYLAVGQMSAPPSLIKVSSDNCFSWSTAFSLAGETAFLSLLYLESGIVLAGSFPNGHICRSVDNGLSWVDIGSIASPTNILFMVYCGNGIVVAGLGNPTARIARSTDYGLTWSISAPLFSQTLITSICYIGNGCILAGTSPGAFILKSTDYGLNWSNVYTVSGASIVSAISLNGSNRISIGSKQNGKLLYT